jgi:hypothetical protein
MQSFKSVYENINRNWHMVVVVVVVVVGGGDSYAKRRNES